MAYASMSDAPAATLAGAVSVDPSVALKTKLPSCEGADYEAVPGEGFSYSYDADLPNPATIVREKPDTDPKGPPSAGFFLAQEKIGATKAERFVIAADAAVDIAKEDASAEALPIIDIPPADGQAKYLAVFFSGDGGWRDIDKSVGDIIAKKSVHVVGVIRCAISGRCANRKTLPRILQGLSPRLTRPVNCRWFCSAILSVLIRSHSLALSAEAVAGPYQSRRA